MRLRLLLALASFALPLTGCAAPSAAPLGGASSGSAPGATALVAPALEVDAVLLTEHGPLDCAREPRRTVDGGVLHIDGCVRASVLVPQAVLPDGSTVGGDAVDVGAINETLEVPGGSAAWSVLVHLHGSERLRVKLDDPASNTVYNEQVNSTGHGDSWVRLEYASPSPGTWHVWGTVFGNTYAREWSVVAVSSPTP